MAARSSSATPRPSGRWPRRCSPTIDRDAEVFRACRAAITAPADVLLERAQEAGVVRPDAKFADVGRMVGGIASDPAPTPEQIERMLDIVLDGLRYSPR